MRLMFGFLVKKWFFDLWDNFLPAILVNLGFVLVLSVPVLLPPVFKALGVILVTIYLGGVYTAASEFTDYRSITFAVFWSGIRENLLTATIFGVIVVLHIVLLSVAVPFYSSLGNWLGLVALAVLFWISVSWILAAQFILPVRTRLNRENRAVFRKSFILLFDNPGFSIGIFLGAIIIFALSIFTAFLLPGITGIAIWYQTALKLRLYKYDFLEENPDERKAIPWDGLLYDDRERVGTRTLRGMIFPWKE